MRISIAENGNSFAAEALAEALAAPLASARLGVNSPLRKKLGGDATNAALRRSTVVAATTIIHFTNIV